MVTKLLDRLLQLWIYNSMNFPKPVYLKVQIIKHLVCKLKNINEEIGEFQSEMQTMTK